MENRQQRLGKVLAAMGFTEAPGAALKQALWLAEGTGTEARKKRPLAFPVRSPTMALVAEPRTREV
jgi:hypothetical protein